MATRKNIEFNSNFLPPEWEDNERMNFMFSAFPENRDLNPKHWDSKLIFWRDLVKKSCHEIDEMYFDCASLRQRFNRNGVTPLGLNIVIKDCVNNGIIIPVCDLRSALNDTWVSWSFGLAKKSLYWCIGLLWSADDKTDPPGEFVMVDLLKKKSEQLLNEHYKVIEFDSTDHIVPWNVLKYMWSKIDNKNDEKSLELAVCYLKNQKKISLTITPEGEKVVKFAENHQNMSSAITEVDLGVLSLKKTIASLKLQVKKLEKEMSILKDNASICVKQGKKTSAIKLLKKMKQAQKILDKKEGCLESSQEVLRRIQQAESNIMILSAYKYGNMALKNVQEGMKVEDVDKIIDDIEEAIHEESEIETTIIEGNSRIATAANGDIDDSELERELQDLILEEQASNVSILADKEVGNTAVLPEIIPVMPSPPRHDPSAPSKDSEEFSSLSQRERNLEENGDIMELMDQLPNVPATAFSSSPEVVSGKRKYLEHGLVPSQ